jgi:hypothetical protein
MYVLIQASANQAQAEGGVSNYLWGEWTPPAGSNTLDPNNIIGSRSSVYYQSGNEGGTLSWPGC